MFRVVIATALLVLPAAASAKWRVAESAHFRVFTQGSSSSARSDAERLEKYEYIMRTIAGVKRPYSPEKVSVFMLPNQGAVQSMMAFGGGGVAGFYNTTNRGPYAIMMRTDTEGSDGLRAQQILFHELSHHFMFQYYPVTYPSWYIEGFADFYGTMEIDSKDVVRIGKPMDNRYLSLTDNSWLPVEKLLLARTYADVGDRVDLLYAEGWLLVHYLADSKDRAGQMGAYLNAINAGKSFGDAAKLAFGDLGKLDRDLHDYADQHQVDTDILPFKKIDTGQITVRDLSPAHAALIDDDMRLYAGIAAAKGPAFADSVVHDAADFADDPYALRIQTEAQMLVKRNGDAMRTVDHWLAVAPQDPLALMFKGRLTAQQLRQTGSKDEHAWDGARQYLLRANKLDTTEPRILKAYYDTFLDQGVLPPAGAQNALVKAFDIVPQNEDIRREVALDYERRGMYDAAIATIRPLAFQIRSAAEQSPKEKAEQDKLDKQYALAGDDDSDLTARDILKRLEAEAGKPAEVDDQRQPAQAAPAKQEN